ncbi:MAG: hypothetical protein OEV30_01390 [Ignavibacteria bacterium]|nr:hypothetical protein [Ignavibacteria bacterium]
MSELSLDEAREQSRRELDQAGQAIAEGNAGKARVCSRRAAGIAIRFWLQEHPRRMWGVDAMNQLRNLHLDQSIPQSVRAAAKRLTSRVNPEFGPPHKEDPVEDSRTIIEFFLGAP